MTVQAPTKMVVIHLARKPLSGTVAATCLKYGTGAINVDGTRIGTSDLWHQVPSAPFTSARTTSTSSTPGIEREQHALGRWPANLILQHIGGPEGCKQVGVKKVQVIGATAKTSDHAIGSESVNIFAKGLPHPGFRDADGTETVPDWHCIAECPCLDLDQQSGVSKSSGGRIGNASGAYSQLGPSGFSQAHQKGDPGLGDTGGASRYFKQVQGDKAE